MASSTNARDRARRIIMASKLPGRKERRKGRSAGAAELLQPASAIDALVRTCLRSDEPGERQRAASRDVCSSRRGTLRVAR